MPTPTLPPPRRFGLCTFAVTASLPQGELPRAGEPPAVRGAAKAPLQAAWLTGGAP